MKSKEILLRESLSIPTREKTRYTKGFSCGAVVHSSLESLTGYALQTGLEDTRKSSEYASRLDRLCLSRPKAMQKQQRRENRA